MTPWLVLSLPWIGVVLFVALRVRLAPELPKHDELPGAGVAGDPLVSVIVPARNEAHNIERLLRSVTAMEGVRFEVLVVDDRSGDGTGELARTAGPGRAERLEVVAGKPLPEGWMGKPWACRQGAERARGDLLLFTDADTVHGPHLLVRAVAELQAEQADALTVAGRQLMESFWERLVQPQIFMSMIFRYPDLSDPIPRHRWRSAIANGQYILFRREAYEALGGHEAVKDAVVEDLRLAQILVRDGWRFRIRRAEDALATRMYRSLGELVAGWSKNVVLGGLQTLPRWLRPVTPPAMLLVGVTLWLAPPVAFGLALIGVGPDGLLAWAAAVTAGSALFWAAVTARFGAPWPYGLLYPVGAAVGSYIVSRSWLGMDRVEWKGRRYEGMKALD